jgi:hypothetical protein
MIIIFKKFKMKKCPCQTEVSVHFCKNWYVISRTVLKSCYQKLLLFLSNITVAKQLDIVKRIKQLDKHLCK